MERRASRVLYLAAMLSGASALTLTLESLRDLTFRADVAAVFSAVAALLGTLAAAGSFQRKWQANRLSRSRMDQLLIDVADPKAESTRVLEELNAVLASHDRAITGRSEPGA
jgi:hypothetical protein